MAEVKATSIVGPSKDTAELDKCNNIKQIESWSSRLRAFYWAHDPRKVDRVEEILAHHRGAEERFLQQVHREFGVRDFRGEEAIDDIYEHQRYSYLSFSWGSSLPGHLLPTDRHRWSGLHGSPSSQTLDKVEPQLPVYWTWTSEWILDKTSCRCDIDGWVYALDFTMVNYLIKKGQERHEPNATDYVRRRRWIRRRRRVLDAMSPILKLKPASNKDEVESHSRSEMNHLVVDATDKADNKYNVAVETIAAPLLDKSINVERIDLPPPPIPEPATLPRSKLEYYSLDMDKTAVDAAWKGAVLDLEQVYMRAKAQQANKKQKWAVKKEKIKRQIHLLKKTIVSMQDVALEEQKRQRENNWFSGSGRNDEERALPSPTIKSLPTAALGDSPTNASNLAARMRCAQSKLDALRRTYWHPRESGYTLRFSIDGIYYGLRDFFVESFHSTYSFQIGHQTNGAQRITPTCQVSMKGHTVCCGKHVKVIGEKGTRIPKSIWESMYMDTTFDVSINLIYVEDIDDQSEGRWEFLLSPEATYVELLNFKRRVKGGMDLPEPMVRKLCSDVLSSLVRDLTLLYFPYELALAYKLPPSKLNIQGALKVTGQSIDHFMESVLQELDLSAIQEDHTIQELPSDVGRTRTSKFSFLPMLEAASTAAQKFPFLATGSNKEMLTIAKFLQLSPPQFNLLIAIKDSGLFPSTYTFRSLASMCLYYNAFSVDEVTTEPTTCNNGTRTQDINLRAAWKNIIELIYIKKTTASIQSPKNPSRRKLWPSVGRRIVKDAQFELFDVNKFFDTIQRLSKKPTSICVSIEHFHSTCNAINVIEALTKLYERIVLGVDISKPRMAADGFIYGLRLGRKAAIHPAMTMTTTKATALAMPNSSGKMQPMDQRPVLDSRRYRPAEGLFRIKHQSLSNVWQTLNYLVDFVRENVDNMSVELAGHMSATDDNCVLDGSFKNANFCGPLSIGVAVSPCFLGFYRAEMVTVGNDRIGMQVDVMLPSASANITTSNAKQQSVIALASIGRVMVTDFSTKVLLNLDALIAREEERRKLTLATAESNASSCELNQHCALSFSFGLAVNDNEEDMKAIGQLNVSTSEFTKLQTTAKVGSFTISLLPITKYVLTHYVQPYVLKAFPQHQLLFDSAKRNLIALLQSITLELKFNIMAKAFIHDDGSLMVTCCGLPLHPIPVMFKNEVYLLDIVLQADDLVNIWIDDRNPPYSNPLYF